jgi:hypothetical protein
MQQRLCRDAAAAVSRCSSGCVALQQWLFRVAARRNVRPARRMIVTVVSFGE